LCCAVICTNDVTVCSGRVLQSAGGANKAAGFAHAPGAAGGPLASSMMRGAGGGQSLNQSAVKSEAHGIAEIVFQTYTGRSNNEEGMHYSAALAALRQKGINLQVPELMNILRQLSDDGRLYSTVDDEHHKPTSEDF
jgi:hypothetical protein